MLHTQVYHNNILLPIEEIRLSPGQAGLLSGWGVFTTIRTYGGRPFAFDRHWKRLTTDADRLMIPVDWPPETVLDHLGQLVEANQVKDGCVRIYLINNKMGHWSSDECRMEVDLILYSTDLPRRKGPVSLALQPHGRHAASPLAGVKVISWLQNVWMLDRAHQQGFEEVVLLNERNEVAECTAANIFCVRRGEAVTPPLSSGCLPGISRATVLEAAGKKAGVRVTEATLSPEDLFGADEVFITSTTREVQPVARIGEHPIAQVAGPVTTRLAKAFSEHVAQSLPEPSPGAATETES